MTIRIYVAGASRAQSADRQRAKEAIHWVKSQPSLELTVNWLDIVESVESGKIPDTEMSRQINAQTDLHGIRSADIFWLLIPDNGIGTGCFIEFGFALARHELKFKPSMIISSPLMRKDRSIFFDCNKLAYAPSDNFAKEMILQSIPELEDKFTAPIQ